mmetsp:Transcript_25620/g.80926  ORF Transcript_25620/g.80926 Transcript_25620/m.80926 type:complete len:310 (+) Transcript_25620:1030-1959(+)
MVEQELDCRRGVARAPAQRLGTSRRVEAHPHQLGNGTVVGRSAGTCARTAAAADRCIAGVRHRRGGWRRRGRYGWGRRHRRRREVRGCVRGGCVGGGEVLGSRLQGAVGLLQRRGGLLWREAHVDQRLHLWRQAGGQVEPARACAASGQHPVKRVRGHERTAGRGRRAAFAGAAVAGTAAASGEREQHGEPPGDIVTRLGQRALGLGAGEAHLHELARGGRRRRRASPWRPGRSARFKGAACCRPMRRVGEEAGLRRGVERLVVRAVPRGAHLAVQLGTVALQVGRLGLQCLEALDGRGVELGTLCHLC